MHLDKLDSITLVLMVEALKRAIHLLDVTGKEGLYDVALLHLIREELEKRNGTVKKP